MGELKKLFEFQDEEGDDPPPPLPVPVPPPTPKQGRAKGKRSDPNYTQCGVYLPKELAIAVKKRLTGTEQDLSDLVGDLLAKWLTDEANEQ